VSKKLGQQVLVVNKPGGGTVVGTHFGLKETKPDGYSFLTETHGCSSMMIAGMLNPPATLEDRVFISRVIVDSMVFAVKVDAPWKTFRELTEWVKAHPKELTYGAGGPAGTSAYGVNDWLSNIGLNPLDARLVMSDSGMDSLIKVAGGHTTLACNTVAEAYTLAQAGKIRVLAVASDKRSPFMPDVPTVAENGLPPVRVSWWAGISAPSGTPQYVVDKWAKALEEVSKDPAFLQQVQNLHYTVSYLGPAEFKDFVYKETEHYTQIANKVGIRK
jgi:tripartite-type tricarboxylate transporter receptor subunit TctC